MSGRYENCIFCDVVFKSSGEKSRPSAEHFWGKELAKFMGANPNTRTPKNHQETHISSSGESELRSNNVFMTKGHPLYQTISKAVCKGCNESWLNDIQKMAMKSLKTSVFEPMSLADIDYSSMGNWIYSRFLLHISTYPAQAICSDATSDFVRLCNESRRRERRRFFLETAPPRSTRIFSGQITIPDGNCNSINLLTRPVQNEDNVIGEQFAAMYSIGNLAFAIFSDSDLVHNEFYDRRFFRQVWPKIDILMAPDKWATAKSFEDLWAAGFLKNASRRPKFGNVALVDTKVRKNFS